MKGDSTTSGALWWVSSPGQGAQSTRATPDRRHAATSAWAPQCISELQVPAEKNPLSNGRGFSVLSPWWGWETSQGHTWLSETNSTSTVPAVAGISGNKAECSFRPKAKLCSHKICSSRVPRGLGLGGGSDSAGKTLYLHPPPRGAEKLGSGPVLPSCIIHCGKRDAAPGQGCICLPVQHLRLGVLQRVPLAKWH